MIGIDAKAPLTPVGTTSTDSLTVGAKDKPTPPSVPQLATKCCQNAWMYPQTHDVPLFQESLKYDPLADKQFPPKRRKTDNAVKDSALSKPRKRLNFNETVVVVPIPMRTEYSNRVRSRLWSNAVEIHENAARNTVEFAAEGWDWRTVTEDDRMYVCVATGELIHPCHYEVNFQSTPSLSS